MIIGADLYHDVTLGDRRKGKKGQPTAQNSIFGWFISGPVDQSLTEFRSMPDSPSAQSSLSVFVHQCNHDLSLDHEIKKFWEVEEIPRKVPLSAEDEACEKHFQLTHSRSKEGRYIVRLPFKTGPPIGIGKSHSQAARQLASLQRRLHANPEQWSEYAVFLRDYEQLGHMRKAPVSLNSVE